MSMFNDQARLAGGGGNSSVGSVGVNAVIRGLPLLRQPTTTTGLSTGGGITQQIVTRNGRRCVELTMPLTGTPSFYFQCPASTYDHRILAEVEIENTMALNGGNVQLIMATDNTFANRRNYVNNISTAAGWSGIHQIQGADALWTTTGSGSWATISASSTPICQLKFTMASGNTIQTKIWIYEVVKLEKDNLPMILVGSDDGHITWYEKGLPILEKYALNSYLAFIRDPVGTTNYMTAENWQDSIKRGHEAVVHGCKSGKNSLRDWIVNPSPYATALEAVTEDIKYNRDGMVSLGLDPTGLGKKCYVYPQGFHQPSGVTGDDTIKTALSDLGFEWARLAALNGSFTTGANLNENIFYVPILGHWWQSTNGTDSATETANITQLIAKIQQEVNDGRSVVLMFHIVRDTPTAKEDISPDNLDKICAAIADLINQGKAINATPTQMLTAFKSR